MSSDVMVGKGGGNSLRWMDRSFGCLTSSCALLLPSHRHATNDIDATDDPSRKPAVGLQCSAAFCISHSPCQRALSSNMLTGLCLSVCLPCSVGKPLTAQDQV